MTTTKYSGVYKNEKNGKYYYSIELGVDKITGKRIQKKSSRSQSGETFLTAKKAFEEATRIRKEYHQVQSYKNYKLTYRQFMENIYLPYYKAEVEESTWDSRKPTFKLIIKRFGDKVIRNITLEDCELFRIYLINESGYSGGYSSLIYNAFRKSLDYCVLLNYVERNVSLGTKSIQKGKGVVPYWTKEEFEKTLSVICINNLYEHM